MEIKDIKVINLQFGNHVEICYHQDSGSLERRCGWFQQLFELPEGMTEIPSEYKANYPIEPPFVEIAYRLGKNDSPSDVVQYVPDKIYWIRELKPTVEF
jgi:hypothetical protein